MNRLEELLVILSEECAEVSQAAIKCVRFGMASTHQVPGKPFLTGDESNQLKLERELGDLLAMFKLLVEEHGLNEANVMEAAEAKLVKVEKFMRNGKGKTPKEMVDAFSKNPLPPISLDKPHRRQPRRNKRG